MKAISVTALLLLVASCATTEKIVEVKVEYRVPDYALPVFPVCSSYDVADDDWIMIPSDFFMNLAKFKNEYKEFVRWYDKMMDVEAEK